MREASVHKKAVLAAGCFWGVEHLLRQLPGVVSTRVGYTGGRSDKPNYQEITTGNTGHAEAVEVTYDPTQLAYVDLLRAFFRLHDPTTFNRQGNDVGSQYRSTIFFSTPEEQAAARALIAEIDQSGKWSKRVVTQVIAAATFYEAEEYHQKYLVKNPNGYNCHFWRE